MDGEWWQQGTPNQAAERKVAAAIAPQMARLIIAKAEALVPVINDKVAEVFRVMVTFMGKQADLASQLPHKASPGLQRWKPLSLDYVKRKGNSLFWLYTDAPRVGRRRHLHPDPEPLIPTLARTSADEAFGGVELTIRDPEGNVIARTDGKAGLRKVRDAAVPERIASIKFHIGARAWGGYKRNDMPVIETLLAARGIIDSRTYEKLHNKGNRRPIIGPVMAMYNNLIIPNAVRDTLKQSFPLSSVKIEVLNPWTGPF